MVDITEKDRSLRYAKAQATVKVSKEETIRAIVDKTVPKGDVLEFARVAGLFAVKKTAELIPDCHPIPVEYTHITYQVEAMHIHIFVEVKTIYRTGVEVEAMHGASVVALTMYDMLKPIDKGIEIQNIRLLEKTGGKSDTKTSPKIFKACLLIYSDGVASGRKANKITEPLKGILLKHQIEITQVTIMEEKMQYLEEFLHNIATLPFELVLVAGGTGITPKDLVPTTLQKYFEVSANSLMAAARSYGLERDFKAMLSEGVAGLIGKRLVVNIPGSEQGALDTMRPIAKGIRKILENNNYSKD